MCHPVVMAGLQVATSVMGASAQASDLKYQAKISKMQAENAFKVAAAQAEFSRYAAERRQASDRVAVFTSGVDPQSASAVDVLSENRGNLAAGEALGDIDATHDHTHLQILVTQPNGDRWAIDPTPYMEPDPMEFLQRFFNNSVDDAREWVRRQFE